MSANNFQSTPNKLAPVMPKEWYHKAIALFKIPSTQYNETSMALYIIRELELINNVKYYIDDYGNIIVIKGDSKLYPCFCAHLDTVHTYPNGFKLLYQIAGERTYLFACDNDKKSVGVGGDDKCGVFACLYLLQRLDHVKIIFFSQEESGGTGSYNIDLTVFDDCQFLGGIDRWNGHDFINKYFGIHTISKAFKKAVMPILKQYGYNPNSGLFTDALNIVDRGIDLSCFNISCGYYSHHSKNEYVDLNELYHACLLCEELSTLSERYEHPYKKVVYNSVTHWDDWDYKTDGWTKDKDGTWRQGAPKSKSIYNFPAYHTKFSNYVGSTMPKTEEEFMIDSVLVCENCGLELLAHEKKYCDTCAKWMKPADSDIPLHGETDNTDLGI